MAAGSKAREILNYSFLVALADDGIIDDGELAYIKSLAMADGMLDEQEKRTLKRVFSLVDESKLTPEAQTELQEFRSRHKVY
jgi:tellurite resistance protein